MNSIVSRHRRYNLQRFIDRHSPDIILIAEHRLSPRHIVAFNGYTVFRQDRIGGRGRGGGTAVLARDSMKCDRVLLDLGGIENTCVFRGDGTIVHVVAV